MSVSVRNCSSDARGWCIECVNVSFKYHGSIWNEYDALGSSVKQKLFFIFFKFPFQRKKMTDDHFYAYCCNVLNNNI